MWTFNKWKSGSIIRRLFKFHLAVGLSLLVNYVMYLALLLVGFPPLVAMFIAVLASFVARYFLSVTYVWEIY